MIAVHPQEVPLGHNMRWRVRAAVMYRSVTYTTHHAVQVAAARAVGMVCVYDLLTALGMALVCMAVFFRWSQRGLQMLCCRGDCTGAFACDACCVVDGDAGLLRWMLLLLGALDMA